MKYRTVNDHGKEFGNIVKCKITAAVLAAAGLTVCTAAAASAAMQICYDGATHWYNGAIYSLYVNGNKIESPMEPIIFNDHALVPVREIFEECGATVEYTGETQCVEIEYNGSYIRMYINDNYAYVNGEKQPIPDNVVPKLINKPGGETKTMVPVRFISETVGMDVEFDGEQGRIDITSDAASEATPETDTAVTEAPAAETTVTDTAVAQTASNITDITYNMVSETSVKITVTCDGPVSGRYSHFTLDDPERVVVDFAGMGFLTGESTINIGADGISEIRTGSDSERARIVLDVEGLVGYSVTEASAASVEITAEVSGSSDAGGSAAQEQQPSAADEQAQSGGTESIVAGAVSDAYKTGIVAASAEDSQKVIMLDAGHGGEDPGAIGNLGGTAINEKDLTLAITYKVKDILESNGYKTSMTRTGDTLPSLTERPAQANAEGCALFVSIHINSAEAESANGTEVYWSEENNGNEYGITSEEFAVNVLDSMIKYTGATDRGVKMANWAVTRRSEMPAILVEVGFISNSAELQAMCDDDYQNKVAKGIAEGIIDSLHKVELP